MHPLVKKILPHGIAVAVFLVVALIYCKPALEGKVLQQSDITQWQGAIQNSVVYSQSHDGKYPLWTNSMFGGMPTFQIGGIGGNVIAGYAHIILTLNLPKPVSFFFLACICFYFLCMVLKIRPYVAVIGALGFAYATYNPVIIATGHDTKMLSIAYMPALLGSLILIYEKKYWAGAALTALFSSVMISQNHVQIVYYLFITIAIMTVFFAVRWIKQGDYKHLITALGLAAVSAITGVLTNATILLSTYEYQKETQRGGASALTDSTSTKEKSKSGLDKDYAFSYSMGIAEPFVMMVPRMFGGSSSEQEVSEEKSKAIEALRGMPQELQREMPLAFYWGGMTRPGEVGVSGPPYSGAVICLLAIMAMFVLDDKHKWWALTAIILTIVMSWGSYFDSVNTIFYKYLPFYNKFRAPSMILVIPQFLIPMLAVLGVNKIVETENKMSLLPALKKGAIATGAILVLLLLMYVMFDYKSAGDKSLLKSVAGSNQPQIIEAVKSFYAGLVADRKSLFLGDIFRTLGFILAGMALLYLMIRNTIKPLVISVLLSAIVLIDLMLINTTYLNKDNYQEPEENTASFNLSKADNEILQDKTFYRVFNVAGNAFSESNTSYHYNSLGGYHSAKLRIYQDLYEKQIINRQTFNMPVLNMLNTKYLLQKDRAGLTQQYQKNDSAYGNCWFAKSIVFVKNADEEMASLNTGGLKDTVFVQESFKPSVTATPQSDSSATIQLVKNDNDIITYTSSSAANQFAVFSEIYYKAGWKAFIDGKETPIAKVNYVLRGISVPAGKHTMEFKFEPQGYITGNKLTKFSLIALILLLLAAIFFTWKQSKQSETIWKENK
jgi:Bacterial membrane protein YfhO